MQTRTKNALAALVLAAALGLAIFALIRSRPPEPLRSRALEAVPAGALIVATADLEALRTTSIGPKLLSAERDLPGLGKVRDVCGIDPMEKVREIALAIPAAGDEGDFGIVAAGDIPDEAILACAAKVIEQRGGKPVISTIGSFRTVRDATLVLSGAEIAARKGGPILLGAGAYLRAMIDAADGRVSTIRSSVAHARLGEQVRGATARVTVVLTPKQRQDLAESLVQEGGPPPPQPSLRARSVPPLVKWFRCTPSLRAKRRQAAPRLLQFSKRRVTAEPPTSPPKSSASPKCSKASRSARKARRFKSCPRCPPTKPRFCLSDSCFCGACATPCRPLSHPRAHRPLLRPRATLRWMPVPMPCPKKGGMR
ncbi:MAG: hypothetical protein IPK82_18055 [Polyangiaceae bacterium]|nr:hypothetical protein [Polyangiaceae bacterium]